MIGSCTGKYALKANINVSRYWDREFAKPSVIYTTVEWRTTGEIRYELETEGACI
jgi:hypothetical protein